MEWWLLFYSLFWQRGSWGFPILTYLLLWPALPQVLVLSLPTLSNNYLLYCNYCVRIIQSCSLPSRSLQSKFGKKLTRFKGIVGFSTNLKLLCTFVMLQIMNIFWALNKKEVYKFEVIEVAVDLCVECHRANLGCALVHCTSTKLYECLDIKGETWLSNWKSSLYWRRF